MKTDQALLLPVGDDLYALPMAWVREVVAAPQLTRLVTAPSVVLGLFNLRGQFKAQHEKMQQAFVSVLTPEQKAQWEKLRAEREQRREERQQQRQQRDQNDDQERQ